MLKRTDRAATGILLITVSLLWLAVPDLVLADDCSDWTLGELASCPAYVQWRVLAMIAGALIAAAGAIDRWNTGESSGDDAEDEKPAPPPTPTPPVPGTSGKPRTDQSPAYDPGGTNMGGGTGVG